MQNEILKELGHNIKVERVKQNYSQEQLAEKAGIQMQHLSVIENGASNVKFLTLIAIMNALDVSLEELYNPKKKQ